MCDSNLGCGLRPVLGTASRRLSSCLIGIAIVGSSAQAAEIARISVAAPKVLCIEIVDGHAVHPPWQDMAALRARSPGEGWEQYGRIEDVTLKPERLIQKSIYTVTSLDDADFTKGVKPGFVARKSKPTDMTMAGGWDYRPRLTHWVYLFLARPLTEGKRYGISIGDAAGQSLKGTFTMDSHKLLSDSIHVSQIGFLPDAPKRAFMSCWAGSAVGLDFGEILSAGPTVDGIALDEDAKPTFHVLTADTRRKVFSGEIRLRRKANAKGDDAYGNNFQRADVYELDFCGFRTPGEYVVCVPGIGCSRPFRIGRDAFREAYRVAAKGLYYQRCGCALEKEHAGRWARKRCHHPDDGRTVKESGLTLTDASMGGGKVDTFKELPARASEESVHLWGGWHDAGDWDRRAQHLTSAAMLLDLCALFPGAFADGELNIPESLNGIADIADEALWCLDFFLRAQCDDGGVRGGIESNGHPAFATSSWDDPLPLFAYAPDPWVSYRFAWCACKGARVLRQADAKRFRGRADRYIAAAEKAWRWANDNGGRLPGAWNPTFRDHAHAAAAELFAETAKPEYGKAFAETSVHRESPKSDVEQYGKYDQRSGAFTYARFVPSGRADQALQNAVRAAIVNRANAWIDYGEKRAFRFATNYWRPVSWGMTSAPDAEALIHAWALTRDKRYVDAVSEACAWTLGGNPLNLVWTSGLGENRVRHVLHIDSWWVAHRAGFDDVVPGLVPSGASRFTGEHRGIHGFTQRGFFPSIKDWPAVESYADVWYDPSICEHVPDLIAPCAAAYGFLNAMGQTSP